jgi:nucleotide-binding universal stress UspA family protein
MEAAMFKNILVPLDGGDLSNNAVKQACAFAGSIGARLVFYYAKPGYFPTFISGEPVIGNAGLDEAMRAAIDRQATALLQDAANVANSAGIESETLSNESDPPHAGIIAAAESRNCDLIFMASHGRHGASALLLGSETQKVLTHCKIPVLVYR